MRTFTHLVDVGGAPGHIPSGLRAQQGVNTHIQGPTCAQHTTPETVAPKTQTTSPTTPHCQHFSPKWSAFWALHHPKPQPRRHQPGGELRHPSLRHADDTPQEGFAWRKTPIATSVEGTEEHRTRMLRPRWRQGMARLRDDAPISDPAPLVWRVPAGSGCSARGWRRGLAAVPTSGTGPGRASSRRAKPISTPGTTGVEGAGGTCRGAGGRRQGLAGLRDDAPSEARGADGSRAGRRPPAHTAAGPTKHTRRPEHPWGHTATQHHHNRTHNETRPRPVSRPRPRRAQSALLSRASASDQAVMSTWSSTAARPASRRATGTRNGEQDT